MFIVSYTAVCLIWGSTYLAVKMAIETMPALVMGGVRFIIAGLLMFSWLRWRGVAVPTRKEWISCAAIGALLIMGGNAGTMLGVKYIPSGVAALVATSLPMWMVLLDWLRPAGKRPAGGVFLGLGLGFAGIILLVQPWKAFLHPDSALHSAHPIINPIGVMLVTGGVIAWALGSLYSRHATVPASPLMSTAAQLLTGGVLMLFIGLAAGEGMTIEIARISLKSLVSLLYLIIFGSIIAFSAYAWLLKNASPAMASSYTYINPLIAVLLGWLIGGEPVTATMLLAGVIILVAVGIIAKYRSGHSAQTDSQLHSKHGTGGNSEPANAVHYNSHGSVQQTSKPQ
jgi:drug/metabolite transporter (DMT)-like permease